MVNVINHYRVILRALFFIFDDLIDFTEGTWRNCWRVALYQCYCLPCGFEPRLVQDFQRNIMFPPFRYWDIAVSLGKTLYPHMLHLTQVGQRWLCVR